MNTATRIRVLGVIATLYVGLARAAGAPFVTDEREQQLVERIQQAEAKNGSFSTELIAPWTALGLAYEESGDHALAIATIERARHLVRVNYGLFSLDEAPLMRAEIQAMEAREDFAGAWDLEQKLLDLVKRYPDDLRTAPIFNEIGDKRMAMLNRYLAGELPPQIQLGCYYRPRLGPFDDGVDSCTAGSSHVVVTAILGQARSYYAAAIGTLRSNERYSSPELRELEMKVIQNSYSASRYADVAPGATRFAYLGGQRSYNRLISYDNVNSAAWDARVATLIGLADWDLVFLSAKGTLVLDGVLDMYKQSSVLLANKGVTADSIEALFSPKIPIAIPTFLPNPLASEQTSATTGYIDVAFDITKYGRSRHVKVIGKTKSATRDAQDALVNSIYASRFRPRLSDGQFGDPARVVVRYYLSDQALDRAK